MASGAYDSGSYRLMNGSHAYKRKLSYNLELQVARGDPDLQTYPPSSSRSLPPRFAGEPLQISHIAAATVLSNKRGDASIELEIADWRESDSRNHIKWVHIAQTNKNLEEFVQRTLDLPGISEDMSLVVRHLISQLRAHVEKEFVHGSLSGEIHCNSRRFFFSQEGDANVPSRMIIKIYWSERRAFFFDKPSVLFFFR